MSIKIYCIRSCGTCKKAVKWLTEKDIDFEYIDMKKQAPAAKDIASWLAVFGSKPMRNTSGGAYRALGQEKKSWGDQEWLPQFQKDWMLLKRPILIVNDQAKAVGFKEAQWDELFGA